MRHKEDGATPAYIARCRGCGTVITATIDDGTHLDDMADCIGEQIRRNLIVERTNIEEARKLMVGGCRCQKEPQL